MGCVNMRKFLLLEGNQEALSGELSSDISLDCFGSFPHAETIQWSGFEGSLHGDVRVNLPSLEASHRLFLEHWPISMFDLSVLSLALNGISTS